MREVRFRGRHIVNGSWVYGYLLAPNIIGVVKEVNNNDGKGIHPEIAEFCLVDPRTVGQSTSLTDKNGVEVYEHDIVRSLNSVGVVKFESGSFVINWDGTMLNKVMYFWDGDGFEGEVIGDTYENPKILKGYREKED